MNKEKLLVWVVLALVAYLTVGFSIAFSYAANPEAFEGFGPIMAIVSTAICLPISIFGIVLGYWPSRKDE